MIPLLVSLNEKVVVAFGAVIITVIIMRSEGFILKALLCSWKGNELCFIRLYLPVLIFQGFPSLLFYPSLFLLNIAEAIIKLLLVTIICSVICQHN